MIVITRATTDEALCRDFEITLNGTPADALGVRVSAITVK